MRSTSGRTLHGVKEAFRTKRLEIATVTLVTLILASYSIAAFSLPEPVTTVAAEIHAEDLSYVVDDPADAGLSFPHARVLPAASGYDRRSTSKAACSTDVEIRPFAKTTIVYHRVAGGPLRVIVQGSARWKDRGAKGSLASGDLVIFELDGNGCGSPLPVRLPISGALNIGLAAARSQPYAPFRDWRPLDPQYPILDGKLDVYGQSIHEIDIRVPWTSFHWPIRIDGLPGMVSRKFYLADEIVLPPGTRLIDGTATPPDCAVDRTYKPPQWSGYVDVDLSPGGPERTMKINVATDASELLILAPAGPTNCPDSISLTIGARLSTDPNIRWLFAVGSSALAIILIIIGLATYWQMEKRHS
jgi:hypothetical protein